MSNVRVPTGVGAFLLAMMLASAAMGWAFHPVAEQQRSSTESRFVLERDVPTQFGDWTSVANAPGIVTNPELQQAIDRLYSQVLTRTYRNRDGYHVMLSIAYGEDQRGGLQAHRPEVCYPGQGFKLLSNEEAQIVTVLGTISGRQLVTRNGSRHEPVTYWFNVGDKPVSGRLERRLEEIRLVLSGMVPDGLLFRVSSVDPQTERALREQERFIAQMMLALRPDVRRKMAGL